MKGSQKFFICQHCGNLIGLIENNNKPISCCGEDMTELVPNTVDASNEKHVPAVTVSEDSISVQVGSIPHPMTDEHHIQFIYVETENGGQRKGLSAGDSPNADFCFVNDKPIAVYEYCNLHGLWKIDLN